MRNRTLLILPFLWACAPKADPSVVPEPVTDRIEVSGIPEGTLTDVVKNSLIAEGLQIGSASPDLITAVPFTFRPAAMFPVEYTYRAVLLSSNENPRVVFSATFRSLNQGESSATTALTSVCKRYPTHECSEAWTKLERMASRVGDSVTARASKE